MKVRIRADYRDRVIAGKLLLVTEEGGGTYSGYIQGLGSASGAWTVIPKEFTEPPTKEKLDDKRQ